MPVAAHGPAAAAAAAVLMLALACGGGGSSQTAAPAPVQSTPAPQSAQITYQQDAILATEGVALTPAVPTIAGPASACTVSPALPAGLSLCPTDGSISGTPTAAAAAVKYTVTAINDLGTATATLTIAVAAAGQPAGNVPGFMALLQDFPSASLYASSRTAAAMAANPWMQGGRFWVDTEDICQDAVLPLADWNADASSVTGFSDPMSSVLIRMTADPDASWNIQDAGSAAAMDAAVAGIVSVGQAARTTSYLLDPENYATAFLLNDYNQTSVASPLLDSPAIPRAAMCAKVRAFGQAFGTSLWSRVPGATLYLTFGPTVVLQYTGGGTGIPATFPDASYAGDPRYNMLPYFCLGLLDACPATGHIADYCEQSYYTFTGLASIKRNLTASKNWVSIFFPAETADIAKSAASWVPLPLVFANPYFQADEGSIYPGACYVTSPADQLAYFTRNAYYCLQQTPAGYLPGVYVEGCDPWGLTGTVSNIPAAWQACLNNALAAYRGTTSLSSLFDAAALDADLEQDLAGNPAWAAECQ